MDNVTSVVIPVCEEYKAIKAGIKPKILNKKYWVPVIQEQQNRTSSEYMMRLEQRFLEIPGLLKYWGVQKPLLQRILIECTRSCRLQ